MRTTRFLGATAVFGLLVNAMLAGTALAQSMSGPGKDATTTTPASAIAKFGTTKIDTSKITKSGYMRSSKLVGADVYNDDDMSIGTMDDLLVGQEHARAAEAVLSVGGFLGIGSKLVKVPFSKLRINKEGHIMLPGATKASLTKLTDFEYNK